MEAFHQLAKVATEWAAVFERDIVDMTDFVREVEGEPSQHRFNFERGVGL